jgi:hypothetical protein
MGDIAGFLAGATACMAIRLYVVVAMPKSQGPSPRRV